jgi:hypothetical protein
MSYCGSSSAPSASQTLKSGIGSLYPALYRLERALAAASPASSHRSSGHPRDRRPVIIYFHGAGERRQGELQRRLLQVVGEFDPPSRA